MCIGNNFSNMFCSLMIYLIINRCILKVFLKKLLIFIPIYESILIYATKKSRFHTLERDFIYYLVLYSVLKHHCHLIHTNSRSTFRLK